MIDDHHLHDFLIAERKARLARILTMDAPSCLVANECLLVIRAINAHRAPGGTRWDSLRFVLADIWMDWRVWVELRLEMFACRVLKRHTWGAVLTSELEETGVDECCYCNATRTVPVMTPPPVAPTAVSASALDFSPNPSLSPSDRGLQFGLIKAIADCAVIADEFFSLGPHQPDTESQFRELWSAAQEAAFEIAVRKYGT